MRVLAVTFDWLNTILSVVSGVSRALLLYSVLAILTLYVLARLFPNSFFAQRWAQFRYKYKLCFTTNLHYSFALFMVLFFYKQSAPLTACTLFWSYTAASAAIMLVFYLFVLAFNYLFKQRGEVSAALPDVFSKKELMPVDAVRFAIISVTRTKTVLVVYYFVTKDPAEKKMLLIMFKGWAYNRSIGAPVWCAEKAMDGIICAVHPLAYEDWRNDEVLRWPSQYATAFRTCCRWIIGLNYQLLRDVASNKKILISERKITTYTKKRTEKVRAVFEKRRKNAQRRDK